MSLPKHIDCLGKYFEAGICRYKNNEGMVIYGYTENNLWIDTSKRKFIRCKTMKTYLTSLQTSSNLPKQLFMIKTWSFTKADLATAWS